MSELSEQDIDRIAELAADKAVERIADRGWIDRETHYNDHQWVQGKRRGENDNRSRRRRIIDQVIGGASTIGLLGLLAWLGTNMLETLAEWVDRIAR